MSAVSATHASILLMGGYESCQTKPKDVTLCEGDYSSNEDDTNHRCPKCTMQGVAGHGRNMILPVLLGAYAARTVGNTNQSCLCFRLLHHVASFITGVHTKKRQEGVGAKGGG